MSLKLASTLWVHLFEPEGVSVRDISKGVVLQCVIINDNQQTARRNNVSKTTKYALQKK